MDNERLAGGVIGALLGFVGGFLTAYRQTRKAQRDATLLRRLNDANSAAQTEDLQGRLEALKRGERG